MIDAREKLIELLGEDVCESSDCKECGLCEPEGECIAYLKRRLADHLIASGVTVREWISVEDRLPEKSGYYLMIYDDDIQSVIHYSAKNKAFNSWDDIETHDFDLKPTHWMPLPEPPKGE